MKTIHRKDTVKKLLKLAEFLKTLPKHKFDFNDFVSEGNTRCGTVCCAAGWAPAVWPRKLKSAWIKNPANEIFSMNLEIVQDFLGLDGDEFYVLFVIGPRTWDAIRDEIDCITPKIMARYLTKQANNIAKTGKIIFSNE